MTLTYIFQMLDITQYAIRIASDTENHMTSVERVMNYASIESEPGYNTDTLPPEQWPYEGGLTLCDLSLAYLKDAPKVLNNIDIRIAPKEKVGIAGRTGAGKSSLVAALFRMPEPEGKVGLFYMSIIFTRCISKLNESFDIHLGHPRSGSNLSSA